MSENTRASLLSLAIIIVLVFSAVSPTSVYADGGPATETPPAAETSTPEPPVEGTNEVDTSNVATEAAQSTDATAPAVETSTPEPPVEGSSEADTSTVATEIAPSAEATTSDADASLLSAVPDDTSVTVLDASGEAQPLATQETMETIATSDPVWCPGAQNPTPGANGCTESFTSFDGLLTFLSEHPEYQGPGTIYVQQGEYKGDDPNKVIDFNSPSYNLGNINTEDLAIVGGWDTSTNAIDPDTPSTFTNYSIHIGSTGNPWGGSVSISNISLDFSSRDTDITGITVVAQDDINLSNVSVTEAGVNGGVLDAGRDVNVINSTFDRSRRSGLIINAGRNVAVANSSFGNPENARHQNFGLTITSAGATSLFGIIANHNRESGIDINSGGRVTIGNSFFSGTKHMIVTDNGTTFLGYGLKVVTPDSIDIDSVTGNDNFLWGASLNAGGDIAISNSEFSLNTTEDPGYIDDTGLFIKGGGEVALNNVIANDNRLYGAQIDAAGTVSINNSTFNNNRGVITTAGVTTLHGHGLQITSKEDIFINNTNALNNLLFGGELTATGEVAIANSNFSNTTADPDSSEVVGKGLLITSGANTSLASVVLQSNQTVGADIHAGGDVYLDLVTAKDNGTDGITVQGSCTHVFGGTYTGNGQYGLNLGSSALEIFSPATFANNAAGNIFPAQPVTCSPAPVTTGSVESSSSMANGAAYSASEAIDFGSVSLNSFLANTRTGARNMHGIFVGKYAYVDTDTGLQIIALDSSAPTVAMAGSIP